MNPTSGGGCVLHSCTQSSPFKTIWVSLDSDPILRPAVSSLLHMANEASRISYLRNLDKTIAHAYSCAAWGCAFLWAVYYRRNQCIPREDESDDGETNFRRCWHSGQVKGDPGYEQPYCQLAALLKAPGDQVGVGQLRSPTINLNYCILQTRQRSCP
jgi:hypothetical protein